MAAITPGRLVTAQRYAVRAKRHKAGFSLRIAIEAIRAGIPVSLGYALIEGESAFKNIYGHDPVANPAPKGGPVTERNYKFLYLPARRRGLGCQGAGPGQLTYGPTQDLCDRYGGCWNPAANIRVAFSTIAQCIAQFGYVEGCARYNGTGQAAATYSVRLRTRAKEWHRRLL